MDINVSDFNIAHSKSKHALEWAMDQKLDYEDNGVEVIGDLPRNRNEADRCHIVAFHTSSLSVAVTFENPEHTYDPKFVLVIPESVWNRLGRF